MGKEGTSRRDLLILGLGLAAVAAGWQAYVRRPRPLEFQPVPGLPGWRQVAFRGISVSGGNPADAVFLGIGAEDAAAPLSARALCDTLYPGGTGPGHPVAVFTDANCPNCRRLEAKLAARSGDLAVTMLDLPLLGPGSESAARAMLAAERQGKGEAIRTELARTAFAPQLIGRVAAAAGIDPDQLRRDMDAPEVTARLLLVRRAANTLGIWGTPALTIGRTLVMGDIPIETLDRLIEDEAATPAGAC